MFATTSLLKATLLQYAEQIQVQPYFVYQFRFKIPDLKVNQ